MSRLTELLQLLQTGVITAAESKELETLLTQQEPAAARQHLAASFRNAQNATPMEPQKAGSMINAILSQTPNEQQNQPAQQPQITGTPKIIALKRYGIAAAAILIIVLSTTWLLKNNPQSQKSNQRSAISKSANPNRATLTLANGQVIELGNSAGIITEQNGVKIINLAPGQLSYENAQISDQRSANQQINNTLTTPKGAQYQLILPDGTKIWLNAASSVTYPTAFTNEERTVTITGEAYLEVVKNPTHPFIVKSANQKITVLGTSFNINAYENESTTRTTLIEGSINVALTNQRSAISKSANQTSDIQKSDITLSPSQQSLTTATGLKIGNPDLDAVLAWKNGLFHFNSAGIEEIMRQVARWYDVDIVYEGKITTESFTGKVARSADISEVLKVLEESGVHFKIQNKTITVYS